MKTLLKIIVILGIWMLNACSPAGPNYKVSNPASFDDAVKKVVPGDTITLTNGTWTDADLVFDADGSEEAPIVLIAETPGKVIFNGKSRLRIAGEYLIVNGLAFIGGQSPRGAVIEYKRDDDRVANHCRVTNCVIDNYNKSDRFDGDSWVVLYGKNNRFDHNYLANKKNQGVTLIVRLNQEKNQKNFHRIDHNFFGYRPRLGSNGGETLRVGVSTYSLSSSNTIIEDNFFYHCNGETEVASIKSSDNIIRRNTFYECEGSLVMRHGDRNVVESNYFIGNNKPETGGLRVINAGHKVYNNHFQGLKGDRFRAALAVMNGVPNSLLNRYHKAKDAVIAHNTFIDCDNIKIGVGSDFERTDIPENILIANNLFYNPNQRAPYQAMDDISGVTFSNNLVTTSAGKFNRSGFTEIDMKLKRGEDGVWQATASSIERPGARVFDLITSDIHQQPRGPMVTIGASSSKTVASSRQWATAGNCGVRWYPMTAKKQKSSGQVISVSATTGSLNRAVAKAAAGDILELVDAKIYEFEEPVVLTKPLTVRAAAGLEKKPEFNYVGLRSDFSFFVIENGGSLNLSGVAMDGTVEKGTVAESMIRTSKEPMIEHYNLFVDDCDFYDLQESRRSAIIGYQSTYADTIKITNSTFSKISGETISLSAEKEDRGKYNAEYVIVENCVFSDLLNAALNLYRGGNDESTFGPFLTINHCVFENVNNTEQGSVLRLIGVQEADIRNSIFSGSGRGGRSVKFEESRWNNVSVSYCNIYQSGKVESFYDNVVGPGMMSVKPQYQDRANGDFRLAAKSPLQHRGSKGSNIGLAD